MYWRDESGREVDFVIERGSRVLAVEVKAGATIASEDYRSLAHFVAEYRRRCAGGLLLYGGERTLRVADGVWAVPWWRVLG
jgi:predicted AAA+ superfamily ATPase